MKGLNFEERIARDRRLIQDAADAIRGLLDGVRRMGCSPGMVREASQASAVLKRLRARSA